MALTEDSKVYACGSNSQGQLGTGNFKSNFLFEKVVFPQPDESIKKIAAGQHSAAISNTGDLYIWGTLPFAEFLKPHKISFDATNPFVDVSIGYGFGCAIDVAGKAYTWGENEQGELGLRDFDPKDEISIVHSLDGKRVTTIACGGKFSIALGITVMHQVNTLQSYIAENCQTADSKKRLAVPTLHKTPESRKSITHHQMDRSIDISQEGGQKVDFNSKYRESVNLQHMRGQDEKRRSIGKENHNKSEINRERSISPCLGISGIVRRKTPPPETHLNSQIDREYNNDGDGKRSKRLDGRSMSRSRLHLKPNIDMSFEKPEQGPGRDLVEVKRTHEDDKRALQKVHQSFQEDRSQRNFISKSREVNKLSLSGIDNIVDDDEKTEGRESHKRESKRSGRTTLKKKNDNKEKEFQELIEYLKRENTILKENTEDLKRQLRQYERSHSDGISKQDRVLQRRYEKLEREYSVLENEFAMGKEAVNALKRNIEEEREHNGQYLKELEEQRAIMLKLEIEIRRIKERGDTKKGNISDIEKERDALKIKNEELQEKIAQNSQDFNEVLEQKDEEIEGIKNTFTTVQETIEQMDQALKRMIKEEKEHRELIINLEKEKEEKIKMVAALEVKLRDSQVRVQQAEKLNQNLKDQFENIIKVYETQ